MHLMNTWCIHLTLKQFPSHVGLDERKQTTPKFHEINKTISALHKQQNL